MCQSARNAEIKVLGRATRNTTPFFSFCFGQQQEVHKLNQKQIDAAAEVISIFIYAFVIED